MQVASLRTLAGIVSTLFQHRSTIATLTVALSAGISEQELQRLRSIIQQAKDRMEQP